MQIQGKEHIIEKVFCNDFEFKIPAFQRPYAWQKEHANDLYDDLFEAANANLDRDVLVAPLYFLGSIVTIKDAGSSVAEVVDGQQRLTTLSLLIALLRYAIQDETKSRYLSQFVAADGNPLIGTVGRSRLAVREDTQAFWDEAFVKIGGIQRLLDGEITVPSTASAKNLFENSMSVLTRIGQASQKQLERLAVFLLKRCILVVVSSPDLDSAFRIFSVLNDRGLNLSAADILKAEVLKGVEKERVESLSRRWESLEDDLGVSSFEELISQVRMIYKRQIVSNITSEYRKDILPDFEGSSFFDSVLEPYGNHLKTIRAYSYEGGTGSQKINLIFRFLTIIDNSDWIAPALVAIKNHGDNAAALLAQLEHIERLAAFLLVSRTSRVPRIKRYSEVLSQMLADPTCLPAGADLNDDERLLFRSQLNCDLYLLNNVPKYVLLRLESKLTDNMAIWDNRVISIEHVLPQNPSVTSEWVQQFGEEEREELVHKIGNLVILSKNKNSSARAFDFARKKDSYFARSGGASFAWTNTVLGVEAWDADQIRSRTDEAVSHLVQLWNLG